MRESLDPEIINTPTQLIELLRKPGPIFNFILYDFKLSSNWVDILKDQTIEGIEVSSDATFEEDDNIAELYPGLYISYLKFTKPVHFVQCSFSGPVQLRDLIFESDFQFFDPTFDESVNIFSSKFLGKSSFRSMTAKKSFTILHSTINSDQLGFRSCTFEDGLAIYACNFVNDLDLGDSVFKQMLVIRMGDIAGKLNLAICEIESLQLIGNHETNQPLTVKDINLSDSTVEKQTQINLVKITGDIKADGAIFQDSVYIDDAVFQGKSWWTGVIFDKNLSIQQTIFEGQLSFAYSQFEGNVMLSRSDFSKADVFFSDVLINADLWISGNAKNNLPAMLNHKISFRGAVISAASIVRIIGVNEKDAPAGSMIFTDALIKGLIDLRELYLESISFDRTVVSGNIQDDHTFIKAIKDRNTARLLKHEAKKINNVISALAYYRVEMHIHFKKLRYWQVDDFLSLSLNYLSNNFGLSWLRGIVFTVGSGLLFFSLFIMCRDGFGFFWQDQWDCLLNNQSFWGEFINFFWLPTGFTTLVKSNGASFTIAGGAFGAIFFILGKVLIAYGIYQIIAAFRKYS